MPVYYTIIMIFVPQNLVLRNTQSLLAWKTVNMSNPKCI